MVLGSRRATPPERLPGPPPARRRCQGRRKCSARSARTAPALPPTAG